jgi:hypothetical protein
VQRRGSRLMTVHAGDHSMSIGRHFEMQPGFRCRMKVRMEIQTPIWQMGVETNPRPAERVVWRDVHLQLEGGALPRGARLRVARWWCQRWLDAVDETSHGHLAGAQRTKGLSFPVDARSARGRRGRTSPMILASHASMLSLLIGPASMPSGAPFAIWPNSCRRR